MLVISTHNVISMINWREALAKAATIGGIAFLSDYATFPDEPVILLLRPALVAFGIAFLSVLKTVENGTTQSKKVLQPICDSSSQ